MAELPAFDLSGSFEDAKRKVPSQVQQRDELHADNAADNCVPTSFALVMAALGSDGLNPQVITDAIFPGQPGPHLETFSSSIDFINSHPELYRDPPEIVTTAPDPDSALSQVAEAGAIGQPTVVTFQVPLSPPKIKSVPGVRRNIGHASVPISFDGSQWRVLNVFDYVTETLTTAELSEAYAAVVPANRGVSVFRRSLDSGALPPSSGGITVAGFVLHDRTHTFDLRPGNRVAWARTDVRPGEGGAGGLLHQAFVDLPGPPGSSEMVDFAAWIERHRGRDRIVLKSHLADGSAFLMVLDPDHPDPAHREMGWSPLDGQGPGTFRTP